MFIILDECTKLNASSSILFFFFIAGFIIMILPFILMIAQKIMKKTRTEVNITIKESVPNTQVLEDKKPDAYGYFLVCEFVYNGKKIETEQLESYNYKPGTKKKALYNPKNGKLLISHNGWYLINPGTWILPFLFGLLIVFIFTVTSHFCFIEKFIHIGEINSTVFMLIIVAFVALMIGLGIKIASRDEKKK